MENHKQTSILSGVVTVPNIGTSRQNTVFINYFSFGYCGEY